MPVGGPGVIAARHRGETFLTAQPPHSSGSGACVAGSRPSEARRADGLLGRAHCHGESRASERFSFQADILRDLSAGKFIFLVCLK